MGAHFLGFFYKACFLILAPMQMPQQILPAQNNSVSGSIGGLLEKSAGRRRALPDRALSAQDVTPVERVQADPKVDRDISIFGYLRGTNMKRGAQVHIAGVGDCQVSPSIDSLLKRAARLP